MLCTEWHRTHLASFTRRLIPTGVPSKIIGTRMDLTVSLSEAHDDFESHAIWNCYFFSIFMNSSRVYWKKSAALFFSQTPTCEQVMAIFHFQFPRPRLNSKPNSCFHYQTTSSCIHGTT